MDLLEPDKSPISTPEIADTRPVPRDAVALATDQVLWALIRALVARGVLEAEEISDALITATAHYRLTGTIDVPRDAEQFATHLALQRVHKALSETQQG